MVASEENGTGHLEWSSILGVVAFPLPYVCCVFEEVLLSLTEADEQHQEHSTLTSR